MSRMIYKTEQLIPWSIIKDFLTTFPWNKFKLKVQLLDDWFQLNRCNFNKRLLILPFLVIVSFSVVAVVSPYCATMSRDCDDKRPSSPVLRHSEGQINGLAERGWFGVSFYWPLYCRRNKLEICAMDWTDLLRDYRFKSNIHGPIDVIPVIASAFVPFFAIRWFIMINISTFEWFCVRWPFFLVLSIGGQGSLCPSLSTSGLINLSTIFSSW